MYTIEIEEKEQQKIKTFSDQAEIGDIMVIVDSNEKYYNHVLLKTYDRLVSLTNPQKSFDNNANFQVKYLHNVTLKIKIK